MPVYMAYLPHLFVAVVPEVQIVSRYDFIASMIVIVRIWNKI